MTHSITHTDRATARPRALRIRASEHIVHGLIERIYASSRDQTRNGTECRTERDAHTDLSYTRWDEISRSFGSHDCWDRPISARAFISIIFCCMPQCDGPEVATIPRQRDLVGEHVA